jgi:hypothetical protein
MKLMEYVKSEGNPLMQVVRTHQHHTNTIVKNYKKNFQSETKQIKNKMAQNKKKWEDKRMHGQFPRSLGKKLVNKEQSYQ